MISKKGIAIGQVFIFMVAAITFAVILLFGYKVISGFTDTGSKIQFTQFKTDLQRDINKIHTEYGSVRKVVYKKVPTGFEEICFLDLSSPYPGDEVCSLDLNLRVCDVWATASAEGGFDAVDENVFLLPLGSDAPPIKVANIKFENIEEKPIPFLCEGLGKGSLSLFFEGKGDHTVISPVS